MEWGALVAAPAAALSNERSNRSPRMLSTLCEDSGVLLVQGPKRFHNLIKFYATAARALAQRRRSCNRAGVGRPCGEDRPLFIQGKVGIIHNVFRLTEHCRWMDQAVEINAQLVITRHVFLHGTSPLTHSVLCEAIRAEVSSV